MEFFKKYHHFLQIHCFPVTRLHENRLENRLPDELRSFPYVKKSGISSRIGFSALELMKLRLNMVFDEILIEKSGNFDILVVYMYIYPPLSYPFKGALW